MPRIVVIVAAAAFLLLTGAVIAQPSVESHYDTNGDGLIDRGELDRAIDDWIMESLSIEDVKLIMVLYYTQVSWVQATPTATPTLTPVPTPVPSPTPAPVPTTLASPTITYTHINQGSLQIKWSSKSPTATGYEVRYRRQGGSWFAKQFSTGVSGVSFTNRHFEIGARYEVQVRAVNRSRVSAWVGRTLVVHVPLPTPTPAPRPSPMPTPTPMANAFGAGCGGLPTIRRGFLYSGGSPMYGPRPIPPMPSDARIAAWFQNPSEPERKPWEGPKRPKFHYGFTVRVIPEAYWGLVVSVYDSKEWKITLNKNMNYDYYRLAYPGYSVSAGNFNDEGIPFNTGPNERNHMMFSAEGDSYRFVVNGHEVPINVGQKDIEEMRRHVGKYYFYESGEWQGRWNTFGRGVGTYGEYRFFTYPGPKVISKVLCAL